MTIYVHANANNSHCIIPASDVNGQLFYFHTQNFKSVNTALQYKEHFEGLISELIQEQIMNLYVLES